MSGDILSADTDTDGFSCRVTARAARRQLRVSVGVVAMLAIGIVSAAVTVGAHPLAAKRGLATMMPVVSRHAETNPLGVNAL